MNEHQTYTRESEKQFNEWKVQLHDLERRIADAPADVRQNYKKIKQDVHDKMAAAHGKLQHMENCGAAAWAGVKAEWEQAKQEFTAALDTALGLLR